MRLCQKCQARTASRGLTNYLGPASLDNQTAPTTLKLYIMSGCSRRAAQPLSRCLRTQTNALTKSFSTTAIRAEATGEAYKAEIVAAKPQWNPEIVTSRKGEKDLFEHGIMPIGSRRRRAAIGSSQNIPFEQLPYQTFQEARAVLQADREKKIKEIEIERGRIQRLDAKNAKDVGGEQQKQNKLDSMRRHLEHLKILADINDPMIKKRFEDGEGMLKLKDSLFCQIGTTNITQAT